MDDIKNPMVFIVDVDVDVVLIYKNWIFKGSYMAKQSKNNPQLY